MIFRFSATAITGRGLADPLAALCDHPGDLRRLDLKIIRGLQEQLEENVLVFVAISGDQSAQLWQRAVTAYYVVCAVDLLHYDHGIDFPLCKGTCLAAGFSLHCTTGYPGNDVALHQNKEDQEWKGSHNR